VNKWSRKQAGREALGEHDTVSEGTLGGSDEELPPCYGIAVGDSRVALKGMWRKNEGCILSLRLPSAPNKLGQAGVALT
jgi:hypothetical protein